ncbi:EAL domain [Citrobacter freundii]|nr:EAL domain [Citrobacter freundii]
MGGDSRESVTGVRLEPVCSLHLNVSFGYEVLSLLAPGMNAEHFFRIISPDKAVNIFIRQARFVRSLSVSGVFTFNLPVAALVSDRLFKIVCSELMPGEIVEIQDPENILRMTGPEREILISHILDMNKRGVDVWLDDVTAETVDFFLALKLPVEGVKTDRCMLHRVSGHDNGLKYLVEKCWRLAPLVLMEGIETPEMKYRVQSAGAQAGQGFLWPGRIYAYQP